LFAVLLIILAGFAIAEDAFPVSISPGQQTIKINESAAFEITVTNPYKATEAFDVFSSDVVWDVYMNAPLVVAPGMTSTANIQIRPIYLTPGVYSIPVSIRRSGTSEVVKKNVLLELLSKEGLTLSYVPAIRGSFELPENFDPRTSAMVKVHLENQNTLDLQKVDIKVRSAVFNNDYRTSLSSFEKRDVLLNLSLSPLTSPQSDSVKISLFAYDSNGKSYQFDLLSQDYEILPFGDLNPEINVTSGLLKTVRVIKLVNTGNVPREDTYHLQLGLFDRIFTKSDPDARVKGRDYAWDVNIPVGEYEIITVTTNYSSLVVVLGILLLLVFGYYVFRSPIVLKKGAKIMTAKRDGMLEIKVTLVVINRGRRPVTNIRVLDLMPNVFEYLKGHEGTLTPTNMTAHEHKGSVIRWGIGLIHPGEDTIIEYQIKSKYAILGSISLPPATAKFDVGNGKEQTAKSNVAETGFK